MTSEPVPAPLLERILDFETARHPRHRKEALIRPQFGCSSARYYQQLTDLLKPPALAAALAYAPQTVARLLRLQDARADARRARTVLRD